MMRWFFKIIFLAVLAALVYGLWLLYQEKTPEEKQELRDGLSRTVQSAGRTVAEAGKRVVEKGQEVYRGSEEE
jgi:sensor c-di-GMP phosphodiesterase-like protein